MSSRISTVRTKDLFGRVNVKFIKTSSGLYKAVSAKRIKKSKYKV